MTKDKKSIQNWWAENPMTYGETHGQPNLGNVDHTLGTEAFFGSLDNRFYEWNLPLHTDQKFGKIFPYEKYNGKQVLEIGCGLGTMLMNWAQSGAFCTGVDLNPTSVSQTKIRFELKKLRADVRLEDANILPFDDSSFDYAYSWGVLHHSPNIEKSFAEIFRVLKPGGEFGIMLYNRRSFLHWYMTEFVEGFLHDEWSHLNPLELASRYGDGHREEGNPHTWPITQNEGIDMLKPFAENVKVRVLGTDLESVLRLMLPGVFKLIPKSIKKALARRWGWSLWFHGRKD